MFVIVALPVQLMLLVPGPMYSMMLFVPPDTVSIPANFRITSFGAVHPLSWPVKTTPIRLGMRTSQGSPAITSTASAPPTPTEQAPSPPAFGV